MFPPIFNGSTADVRSVYAILISELPLVPLIAISAISVVPLRVGLPSYTKWRHDFRLCKIGFRSFLNSAVLTSYLTNGLTSLERFPISFKTQFSGHCFHHVVLGVYCNGRYGSLGMSRRQDLMDKPLTHRTLGELVAEFESSYKRYQHTLKKVRRDGKGEKRRVGMWYGGRKKEFESTRMRLISLPASRR